MIDNMNTLLIKERDYKYNLLLHINRMMQQIHELGTTVTILQDKCEKYEMKQTNSQTDESNLDN